MTGLGLGIAAAAAIYAAYKSDNGARCLAFIIISFFAILGASQS